MENAPDGRFFFRGFLLGILQPHRKRGRGLRPLSFAANETRAKGRKRKMESINQVIELINGYFANAKAIYWCASILITLLGGLLVTAGCRYYKRLLFLIGAVPTYLVMHCICSQFGWSEVAAIALGLFAGLSLIILSWAYIMVWGFWTTVGIVFLFA